VLACAQNTFVLRAPEHRSTSAPQHRSTSAPLHPPIQPWYTRRPVSSRIVLIGPADALSALKARFDQGDAVQTFTDSEALEALDHVIRTKPSLVALQDEFSVTSRGTALINRIKDDPTLVDCEVRVLARNNEKSRTAMKRGQAAGPAVALDEPVPVLDRRGTRRATYPFITGCLR